MDLRAKLASINVAGLLGSYRTTMPVYNSCDYWITCSIDDIQKAAAEQKQHGFRGLKLRLTGKIADDVARAKAVREVVGPDFAVLGDLNQRTTVPNAIRLGHALEEFNLTWFEEPIPHHDHAGEAEISAALDTPVASGESVYGSRGILDMLRVRASDIVMPDLQHMGGPTEFLQAATFADAYDTPVSNHCYTEMSMQLLPPSRTPSCSNICRGWSRSMRSVLTRRAGPRDRAGPPGLGLFVRSGSDQEIRAKLGTCC